MIKFLDVLSFFIDVFTTLFPFLLLNSFLPMRGSRVFRIPAFLLFSLINSTVIYPNDPVNVLYAALVFIFYMFLFYHARYVEKISAVIIVYPVIVAINYLTQDVGLNVFQLGPDTLFWSTGIHTGALCLRLMVWFFIWLFFKERLSQAAKILTVPMWVTIDSVCLASFVGIITVVVFSPKQVYLSYPACVACMITSLGCVYLTAYISKTVRESLETQNFKLQQSYYEELEQNQNDIRKLRHDMNNHISVIGIFLEQDDKEKARAYFTRLLGSLEVGSRTFCKNSIVNAILNAKYNLAIQNQIDTFFNIDLNGLIAMDDISLCSLFANTLDNAIEASSGIEDRNGRKLFVKARYDKGYLSYEIRNSKSQKTHTYRGKIVTGKQDKKAHGFGLERVREIVANYNGTMDISYTENTFVVIVLIGNLM